MKDEKSITFDKAELSEFWDSTKTETIKQFVEYCENHELMIGCDMGDIKYLAAEFSKTITSK